MKNNFLQNSIIISTIQATFFCKETYVRNYISSKNSKKLDFPKSICKFELQAYFVFSPKYKDKKATEKNSYR